MAVMSRVGSIPVRFPLACMSTWLMHASRTACWVRTGRGIAWKSDASVSCALRGRPWTCSNTAAFEKIDWPTSWARLAFWHLLYHRSAWNSTSSVGFLGVTVLSYKPF